MDGRMKPGRLHVLQIYRLLQWVRENDREKIEKMLTLGVEDLIHVTEPSDGKGVLHVAVPTNNLELVSFLLSKGANPNTQDKKGRMPAMLAAQLGNDEMMALLADNQADLTLRDNEGRGLLFYLIYPTRRHIRCLQVALNGQADVNNVSSQGTHVFQAMCEKVQECLPMCLIMLDEGADPNATNQQTRVTALMEAAKAGSVQLVRAILRNGGNPNALDHRRFSAVHYAAMGGCFEMIRVLSAYAADMGLINMDECTPLHYAAAAGDANCCKFLAQRGCNPKVKNLDGLLPRQIAKDAGHKAAAKELRKAERQQKKGSTDAGPTSDLWALTLHDWSQEFEADLWEAFGDTSDVVTTEMFVSALEDLKAPVDPDQLREVVSAHAKGREDCINVSDFIRGAKYVKKAFLLASYMPKKKKGGKGGKGGKKKGKLVIPLPICTVLPQDMPRRRDGGPPHFMIEAYANLSDVSRFDSEHPPAHLVANDSGWYVTRPDKAYVNINHCVASGDLESLDLALRGGLPVDVHDPYYKTPLMVACSSGNYEVAQFLLSRGADVNVRDQFFWTALHHAAYAGEVELIELLVEAGAAVDARTLSGATPLMRAIESSRASSVDALIKAGANVHAENKKGLNCLEIARVFADSRIVDLVKDKMGSKYRDAPKGKGDKAENPKQKGVAASAALHTETSTATVGKTSPQKDSQSVILHNTSITTGKTNAVDITFVPKTVWGKPPTTSQLMSKIERRKELLTLEVDFDDFMMPFSQNIQRKTLELARTTD